MDVLRRRLEQQEYNALVQNIKPARKISLISGEDSSRSDSRLIRNQISAIINILLSMVSVFVAIFTWMKSSPDHVVRPRISRLTSREFCGVCSLLPWSAQVRPACTCYIGGMPNGIAL